MLQFFLFKKNVNGLEILWLKSSNIIFWLRSIEYVVLYNFKENDGNVVKSELLHIFYHEVLLLTVYWVFYFSWFYTSCSGEYIANIVPFLLVSVGFFIVFFSIVNFINFYKSVSIFLSKTMKKRILCRSTFNNDENLKQRYLNFHNVDRHNYFCQKLFNTK